MWLVSSHPNATAFAVTFARPSSLASVRVRVRTPPRDAAVMASRGWPTRAESPAMLMMRPNFRSTIPGATAWQQ